MINNVNVKKQLMINKKMLMKKRIELKFSYFPGKVINHNYCRVITKVVPSKKVLSVKGLVLRKSFYVVNMSLHTDRGGQLICLIICGFTMGCLIQMIFFGDERMF